MSRHVFETIKEGKSYQVAYGLDHMLGYFLTVYDEEKDEGAGEGIILDVSMYDLGYPKHRGDIIKHMQEWNVPQIALTLVALDLPLDHIDHE